MDNKVFQGVFGDIVTLLIALLAVSRKIIVMDIESTTAGTMLGLVAIALASG